jgi:hypothetical protein
MEYTIERVGQMALGIVSDRVSVRRVPVDVRQSVSSGVH